MELNHTKRYNLNFKKKIEETRSGRKALSSIQERGKHTVGLKKTVGKKKQNTQQLGQRHLFYYKHELGW